MKLDEHQLKAVRHLDGPALVVAGPGSGKTTVIIERILNLIREHDVEPENILAIAFTNAAADEMKDRINKHLLDQSEPKICTLHSFGKEIITTHYEMLGFSTEPETWDAKKTGKIIRNEKRLLKRETQSVDVAIYKFEGRTSKRVYIGQSIKPKEREKEHRNNSSNRGLRDALKYGDEIFDFTPEIDIAKGANAYAREKYWIQQYRNKCATNLVEQMEDVTKNISDIYVDIFKLKSLENHSKAYFGFTTELRAIREQFDRGQTSKIVFDEVLYTNIPLSKTSILISREIRKHKDWAVFNREDPINARYRNQLHIEIFCEHFNVPYEEVLEKPENFENLYEKYDNLRNVDIEKEKRKVDIGLFKPEKIEDPVIREFAKKYEERKRDSNGIDFQDMLIYSAYLLENNQHLLKEYLEEYRYVFVDEFQDISPSDYRLIDLFSEYLFAVGDDDQAIYGFRGGTSSIMQEKFGKRQNVIRYENTRNYRSRRNIVLHSRALIENNERRISKDLHSDNLEEATIKVKMIPKESLFKNLLEEISEIQNSNYQNVGILARNWKGEINDVQEILDCSEIRRQGYKIEYDKLDENPIDEEDYEVITKRQKMSLCKDFKKIEIMNIYAAKGREWDKVILLVNTRYDSIPDYRNDLAEERRLFYVAVTRAKHELLILNVGHCHFIDEFQELPLSERKKQLFTVHKDLLFAFRKRLTDAKEQLRDVSEELQIAFMSQREGLVESSAKALQKQYETELEHWRKAINETNSITEKIKTTLPQQLKKAKTSFLPELIPVLDQLELAMKDATETIETDNLSNEFAKFYENIHSAQGQFLDLLKSHGLKRIESQGKSFIPSQHEETQSRVFSNEVPKGMIVRELQKGYILNDNIIRKAQVVVSKGEKQSDWYLNFDLTQSLCFVTNDDIYFLQDISIDSEIIRGFDTRGLSVHIQKSEVLFVATERNWGAVNPVQHEVNSISIRNAISDKYLRALATKKDEYIKNFVIKTGYVLCGRIVSFDNEVINISIDKKIIVIFRHGILAILDDLKIEHILEEESPKEEIPIPPVDESINDSKTHGWGMIMKAYANGTPVNGKIIKNIKGGLRVRIGSLQGFLPTSQVDLQSTHDLNTFIGKTLEMKIIEFNQQQENLVLSRRALLEEKRRNEFLETIEIGQTVNGVVKNITTFGAFVDLGCIVGLIHKSELTWKPVKHPSEVIAVDDRVEVKIIGINPDEQKISLSMKQTQENLLKDLLEKYPSKR